MKFNRVVWVLLLIFGVFAVFKAPGDPDFGWHFKYGEYLIQHGHLLRENTFSYTFTDYKWANSYWISETLLYLSHQYLGHLVAGLLFSIVLVVCVAYYVKTLAQKSMAHYLLQIIVCSLLFLQFCTNTVTVRPMYFSSIFLMLLMTLLLSREFTSSKKVLLSPLLFLIWANTHADFMLGLCVFGLFVLDAVVERTAKKQLCVAGLLSVVVTMLNPYGTGLWATLFKESHPYQFKYIGEWVPVNSGNLVNISVYCATIGFIVVSLIGARRKLPLWYLLSTGLFTIFSVRSQYFLRISTVLAVHAFLVYWSPCINDVRKIISYKLASKLKVAMLTLLIFSTAVVSGVFVSQIKQSQSTSYWILEKEYPQEALEFALKHPIYGRVFNYYGWGGYMIWKYPQIKTFVDGRMPSWRENNKSIFEDYMNIVRTPDEYAGLLQGYGVDWIIYPTDTAFVSYLKKIPSKYKEIYTSEKASIFVIIRP